MDTVEVKGSMFAVGGSMLSAIMGWLNIATFAEAMFIAVTSTIVGFFTSKAIKYFDRKVKVWVVKRNKSRKA
jgi:hypothetical protein